MEELVTLLIPAFLGVFLVRALLLPMKWGLRLALHGASGFLCLWVLNWAAEYTGILFPVNAVTVLTAGVLGIPGIGILAVLAVI